MSSLQSNKASKVKKNTELGREIFIASKGLIIKAKTFGHRHVIGARKQIFPVDIVREQLSTYRKRHTFSQTTKANTALNNFV